VQTVIALMRDGLHQEIPVCQMAHRVNLTASHLSRLFKAETGLSPNKYLKVLRMEKAKVLLESTFLNIKEIMNKVGVRDESHFVRDFKNICGKTPGQYRVSFRLMPEPHFVIPRSANDNHNRPINKINRQ
jgi:transcriptional regulator GlxA family with amidase domain